MIDKNIMNFLIQIKPKKKIRIPSHKTKIIQKNTIPNNYILRIHSRKINNKNFYKKMIINNKTLNQKSHFKILIRNFSAKMMNIKSINKIIAKNTNLDLIIGIKITIPDIKVNKIHSMIDKSDKIRVILKLIN